MSFTITLDPRAISDVQQAIDYYEEQQIGLGERFETLLNEHLVLLETNPMFRIRYDNIRCLPVRNFPYMVHFTVDEDQQLVIVRAVFHTSLNPKKWRAGK
jgi:toxin ParE1/3/4